MPFWWLQCSVVLIHGFLACTFHFKEVNWKHYVLPFCLDLKPPRARSFVISFVVTLLIWHPRDTASNFELKAVTTGKAVSLSLQ